VNNKWHTEEISAFMIICEYSRMKIDGSATRTDEMRSACIIF